MKDKIKNLILGNIVFLTFLAAGLIIFSVGAISGKYIVRFAGDILVGISIGILYFDKIHDKKDKENKPKEP